MVLDCIVDAARRHYELHLDSWHTDRYAKYRDADEDTDGEEKIPGRKEELLNAMGWRLRGDEEMYLYDLARAYYPDAPRLSYQELHNDVVKLMCEKHGFKKIEILRSAYFFGWSNLCIKGDWGKDSGNALQRKAVSLVRRLVCKGEPSSAEKGWSASRKRARRGETAAGEEEDKQLCLDLGVEYIPYNHPDAVEARRVLKEQEAARKAKTKFYQAVARKRLGGNATKEQIEELASDMMMEEVFSTAFDGKDE